MIAFAAELARMIVEQRECFLNSRCAGGGINPLGYFFDLSPRVEIIVAFPRLRMFPPCLCISAMRSKVEYIADWIKILTDGSQNFGSSIITSLVLFSSRSALVAALFSLQLLCRSSTTSDSRQLICRGWKLRSHTYSKRSLFNSF